MKLNYDASSPRIKPFIDGAEDNPSPGEADKAQANLKRSLLSKNSKHFTDLNLVSEDASGQQVVSGLKMKKVKTQNQTQRPKNDKAPKLNTDINNITNNSSAKKIRRKRTTATLPDMHHGNTLMIPQQE